MLQLFPKAHCKTEMFPLRYKGARSGKTLKIGMQILHQKERASGSSH
jgi:hypothetical protein